MREQRRASKAKRRADPIKGPKIAADERASTHKRRAIIANAPPMAPEDEKNLRAISFTCGPMNLLGE
uniref:hypothetical protein n=1 Tax=Bradyrhizobium sp. (strain ORS 278) TaxID=114615 RepID=UPI0012FED489|nr:hypothetical protein [Bradyrhizobium sp. ORS 278]